MKLLSVFLFLFLFFSNMYSAQLDVTLSTNVANNEVCKGSYFQLYGLITGGTEPYTVKVSLGNNTYTAWVDDNEIYADVSIYYNSYIKVEISDAFSEKHTDSILVKTISKTLDVDFTYLPTAACSGEPITFNPTVLNGSGTISYSWTSNESGHFSTNELPTKKFNAWGCTGTQDYSVKLTATDENMCSSDVTKSITISRQPRLLFSDGNNSSYSQFSNCINNPTSADPDFKVELVNHSTDAGCISEYNVDWGDGSTESNVSFPLAHTYTQLGAFDLVVTGNSTTGCDGIFETVVKNQSNPAVGVTNLGNTKGCEPIEFKFLLAGYNNNSPQTSYIIDFGDGITEEWDYDRPFTNDTIKHAYKNSSCTYYESQYTLRVQAINTCDNTEATASGIKVWDKPNASIGLGSYNSSLTSDTLCVKEEVSLVNRSTAGNYGPTCSALTDYTWIIPGKDTIRSTSQTNEMVSFDTPGTYTVELVAENGCGARKDDIEIVVTEPPVADAIITPNTGCAPLEIKPENKSTGEFITYKWTVSPSAGAQFINGTGKTSEEPEIRFNAVGAYKLTLTVENGCASDSKDFNIKINDAPHIALDTIEDYCHSATLSPGFINSSDTADSYEWTFTGGTPASSIQAFPTDIKFDTPGTYKVHLKATNACGSGDAERIFSVKEKSEISVTDQEICNSETSISIEATGKHVSAYSWGSTGTGIFGDASAPITSYTFSAFDKTFDEIHLVAVGKGNVICGDAHDTLTISIIPEPEVNLGDDIVACKTSTINLSPDNISSYKSFVWKTNGDGTFSDTSAINPAYYPGTNDTLTGEVKIYVNAVANAPCSDIISDTINVELVSPPKVFAGNDSTLCSPDYTVTNASVLNTSHFTWTHNGNGSLTGTNTLTPNYTVHSDDYVKGEVDLYVSANVSGCEQAADTLTLTLPYLPYLNVPEEVRICEDKSYHLDINAGDYINIQHSTTGTGTFSSKTTLPSTYTLSNNDITTGNTHIITTIRGDIPCNIVKEDTTLLTIVKLPVITPMPDQIIGEFEDLVIDFATAENYDVLNWSTTGTGTFTELSDLNSSYQPSESDISNESVQIILWAYSISPCDTSLLFAADTFVLQIVPKPIIDAGDSVTICEDSDYQMAVNHASAERYSAIFWTTNGSGSLNNENTLTPSYIPSNNDIINREVTFYLNAKGEHPITHLTFTDSMHLSIMHNAKIELQAIDTFCESKQYSPIIISTSDVDSYLWSSNSVSGYVDNNAALTPYFTPDADDILAGTVSLYVKTYSISPCTSTAYDTTHLSILHNPIPDFNMDQNRGCGPLEVNFTNKSEGEELDFYWEFGNFQTDSVENPANIIFNAGVIADTSYTVTLFAQNRCNNIAKEKEVIVMSSPTADFAKSASWGCSPLSIDFINVSLGLPTNYTWNWGDASAETTVTEPQNHTFTTGDTNSNYLVSLIAKNDCGIDTTTETIRVFPNTVEAFFEVDTNIGCAPLTIEFTSHSRGDIGSDPFLEWSWNFGDGNVLNANQKVVEHVFTTPGTYTVSQYVHDSCAYDTATRVIKVLGAEPVDFVMNAAEACMYDSVLFEPVNIDYSKVGNLRWNFGDGNEAFETDVAHTYDSSATFHVELTATDIISGCDARKTKPLSIHPVPVSNFTPSTVEGCMPLRVNFTNLSNNADYYVWKFQENASSIYENVTHTFDTSGIYRVLLDASNSMGCNDTSSQKIIVNPIPQSSFARSTDQSCFYPVAVDFTNTSSGYDAIKWNIDGNITEIDNPGVNFDGKGSFPIELICYNRFTCTDTARYTYHVYNNPVADFMIGDPVGCDPYQVTFTNTTNYGNSYEWTFNETDTSHAENPVYTFHGAGNYAVDLIAIGDGNCRDTIRRDEYITVNPSPTANFEYEQINDADTVQFLDYSSGSIDQTWHFGDGDTSHILNPLHKYPSYGTYQTSLVVINEYDCTDTISKEVELMYYKGLYLPNAMSPNNETEEVQYFRPSGIGLARLHIVIYDSWGNKLWETTSLKTGRPDEYWDGTDLKGNMLPPDTYFWHIKEASFNDGTSFKGDRYGIIMIVK